MLAMRLPDSLLADHPVAREHPLAPELSVRSGGAAACFVEPINAAGLADLLRRLRREGVAHRVLGGGANVVVADAGIDEVVVSTRRAKHLAWEGERLLVAGAGLSLPWLVSLCRDRGISGLEPLVGIPGTVGGAVRMNAGGRFGEIGALVKQMTVVTESGEIEVWQADPALFSYRQTDLRGATVIDVLLELVAGDRDRIRCTMRDILLEKARSQPLRGRSTGCFFRNHQAGPAGRLIDQAGLKGLRRGGARISDRHANFFINEDGATTSDLLELARLARRTVQERFGVLLVPEVDIWGESL